VVQWLKQCYRNARESEDSVLARRWGQGAVSIALTCRCVGDVNRLCATMCRRGLSAGARCAHRLIFGPLLDSTSLAHARSPSCAMVLRAIRCGGRAGLQGRASFPRRFSSSRSPAPTPGAHPTSPSTTITTTRLPTPRFHRRSDHAILPDQEVASPPRVNARRRITTALPPVVKQYKQKVV